MTSRLKPGFSLIEILIVIATIATLAATGYLVAVKVRQASASAKLNSDVAMLNRAVTTYRANGGILDEAVTAGQVLTADKVLQQLCRKANNTKIVSGMRSGMVDPRLTIQLQSAAEASGPDPRAFWNNATLQFEIATTGSNGIKEFTLGDVAIAAPAFTKSDGTVMAAGMDDRKTTFDLAQRDNWVWDYTNAGAGATPGPTTQPTTQPTGGGTQPPATDKVITPLDPPTFSLQPGAYALRSFPKTLTLSLPAGITSDSAAIMYLDPIPGGGWVRYTSASVISVDPGQVVTAKTVTLDPDNFSDSGEQANLYTSSAEALELTLSFAKANYNYGELGGPLALGSVAQAAPGTLTVTGPTGIESRYFNDTNFQLYWTTDGSDPASATSTRTMGPAFSGAPPAVALPLTLTGFASGTSRVRAVAISLNTSLFVNSPESTKTLGIEKTTLGPVSVVYNGTTVAMAPVSLNGQPANPRIFYTTSGNDPGHNGAGDPSAGDAVAYGAPVTPAGNLVQFSARIYPPAAYKPWFNPGPSGLTGVSQPAVGNFYATTSSEARIYQFDPATGRSIILTDACLFAPASVAYLSAPVSKVFYLEQSTSAWRLGSYSTATSVHADLGSLTSASWSYVPNSRPSNLTAYNGSLFYIPDQTDDLIRIDFNADGTIRDQYKFADITNDAGVFTNIGDIAVTPAGKLYLSASNAWVSFDVRTLAPVTMPATTPSWVWSGLLTDTSGTLLGVRTTEPDKFYTVNPTTGVGTTPFVFSPARAFDDFGSPVGDIPFNLPTGHYAISPGRDTIYRVSLETGRNYPLRTGLGFVPGAIAYQPGTGKIFLTTSTDIQLYQYNPADNTLVNFTGMYASGISYIATTPPRSLAWYNNALYYAVPGTDDLVRMTLSGTTIATRAKVADLDGNATTGTLDGMTIGPDGVCYFANSDVDRLAFYDLANLGGFTPITQSAPSKFTTITFDASGQMLGVLNTSAADRVKLVTINESTGLTTSKATFQPAIEFSDITGLNDTSPTPVTSNYYTVDGATPRIYRLDPATGQNSILTASAPWAIGSIALDPEKQFLYYTRAGSYEMGYYSIAANTHTLVTSLNAGTLTYAAAAAPANLTWFNGSLYYVTPGTDDLVRVDLSAAGAVADAWKEADLNGNAAIGTVGDLAVDSTGLLYLSTDTRFARFDMKTLSGFVTLSTDASLACASLFTLGGTSFTGTTTVAPKTLRTISAASGALGSSVATSPSRTIADAASAQSRVNVVPPAGGQYYATVTGRNSLYTMDVTSGSMKPATAICPVAPESVAWDPDNKLVYYTEVGGNASTIRLYKYNPATQIHSLVGNLAGAAGYTLTTTPKNLIYLFGDLYCIPLGTDAISGDDFVRIRISSGTPELVKMMDLSGNTVNMGTVGALAVNPSGTLYFSREDGNLLGNVSLYTPRNWTVASGTSKLTSMVVFSSSTPRGTDITTPTVVENVHPLTGVRSAGTATVPSLAIRDIAGITVPSPTLPECYAVGGGNTSIYKFNPYNGANRTVTSTAPFILNAIARSPSRNRLYYLENAATNWRLGSYDIANDTHSILATLGSGVWTNIPAGRPNNLFLWDNNLFFIAPNSDDLYQITLDTAGTTVTNMAKVDDLSFFFTNPPLNFIDTGDVAVGTDANAQISAGGGVNGYFRMFSHKELVTFPPQNQNWRGLLINASGQFYGSKDTEETRIYEIQRGVGTPSNPVDTFPAITFWDMAGEEPSRPASTSNSLWSIAKPNGHLGEFLNWNLLNATSRDWGELKYLSGGAATSFPGATGGYQLESLAVSDTNTAYFVRNYPTTVDGVTYQRPLFTLNLNNLVWGSTPTPPVATFVGDLAPVLSQLGTLSNTAGQDLVTGLCVGLDWKLQILFNKGDDTAPDYLLRVNSLNVNTAKALTNISIIGQITGAGETCTGGKDLVHGTGPVNSMYVVDDADDKIYAVNYQTAAITSVLSTEPGSSYEGLTSYQTNGELIAVNGSGGSPTNAVRTVVSGTSNDTTRFDTNAISGGSLANLGAISFPIAQLSLNTDPMPACYAIDRSARIYRVDPTSGVTTIETTGGLFNMDAVAYDVNTSTVFYLENSDSTIRVAKYKDGVHTLIGDLKTTGVYKPATHPQHLLHYGDSLYYVNNGTSDVVRVRLNSTTTSIISQSKLATMSAGATWTVTSAALDNNGVLYFNEGVNQRSYNLRNQTTLSSAVAIPTGATRNALLHVPATGAFYSGDTFSPARISSVTLATGAAGSYKDSSPPVTFFDMAGGTTSPSPIIPVDTTFYATDGTNAIYMVDPITGENTLLTTTSLFTNIACVATDKTGNKIYYLQQGTPYNFGVYDRSANTHTLLAALQNTGNFAWALTSQPLSLTWFNSQLYFVVNNSDYIRIGKIELEASGIFSDTMEERLAVFDPSFGTIGDVAVDNTGWMYLSGSSRFSRFKLSSSSNYEVLSSAPASYWTGLMMGADGSTLYGTRSSEPSKLYIVDKTNGAAIGTAPTTAPARSINDLASPQQPVAVEPGGLRYETLPGCWTIHRLNLDTGDSYLMTTALTTLPLAIAHAHADNLLFTIGFTAWDSEVTIEKYDLNTGFASVVGSLKSSSLAYPCTASTEATAPHAVVYAKGKLYYIPNNTDDLVEVTLNATKTAIASATKVADLNANTTLGTVEAMTLSSDGTLYISRSDQHFLYSWNFINRSSLTVLSNVSNAKYTGLTFSGDGVLHGFYTSSDKQLRTFTGSAPWTSTYKVTSWVSCGDVSGVNCDAIDPLPPACFAINRTSSIYRIQPTNGATTLETSSAPFTMDAVAYDVNSGNVFYVENSDTTIRLGKYSSGTHTIIGDLKTTGVNKPTTHPQHLVHFGDSVYYINNGTTDLIRVQLNPTATSITTQTKYATLSGTSAWTVTAAAMDNNGILYFQEGNNQRSYDLRNKSTLTAAINTGATRNALLYMANSGTFYTSATATPTRLASLTISSGVAGGYNESNPSISLLDVAGGTNAPAPYPTVDSTLYATDGTTAIYMVDATGGYNTLLTNTTLFSSIAAVAADKTGSKVYYLQQGAPYGLAVYDRTANTHTVLAYLQTQGGFTWAMTSQPSSLTWFNNHLYFYINENNNLRLAKIELNPDGTFHDTMEEINTTWDDTYGTIGDIAVDSTGMMYLTSSARFCRYNMASSSGFEVLSSAPSAFWTGLMFGTDGTTLYGTSSYEPTKLYTINKATGEPTGTGKATAPARSMTDLGSPQQPVAIQPNGLRYMITPNCWTIHRLNLDTGADYQITSLLNGQPTAIAHAYAEKALYLIDFTDWDTNIFLEKYDLQTGFTTVLGSLKSGSLSYPNPKSTLATAPHAMVYAGGKLYYVAYGTDDLIEITLNADKTSIVNAAKVVDLNGGTTLGDVEALTLSSDGMLYISRVDAHYLARYDFANRGALTVLSNVSNAKYNALTFSDAGVLHGFYTSSDKQIRTFTGSSPWTSTYKVTGWTSNGDTTGLNADAIIYNNPLSPVYAVGDFSRTATSDFRNVAKFTADGALDTSFNVGAGANAGATVRGLARASDGKVLVGGDFSTMGGTSRNALARLNTDGTLDTTFTPAVTVEDPFVLDWSTVSMVQEDPLTGADTNISTATNVNQGLSTAGGFSGFDSQTLSNAGNSGINLTLNYSQNMSRVSGTSPASVGPALYSASGGGGIAGVNPDARVTGPYALTLTTDRTGTVSPSTLGLSFSAPVYIDSVILGGLSTTGGIVEHSLIRAWSGANAGGSLVAASNYENFSAEAGPFYGSASDPATTNAANNVVMGSGSGSLYYTQGNGADSSSRYGRVRMGWATNPIQSAAVTLWAPPGTGTTTVSQPLGITQNFSIFTFGNFSMTSGGGSVGGGVATGGNATYTGLTIGSSLTSAAAGTDQWIVKGAVVTDGNGSLQKGNAVYGSATTSTNINKIYVNGGGTKRVYSNNIDFTGIQTSVTAQADSWKAMATTSGASASYLYNSGDGKTAITINAGSVTGLVIVNVDATKFTSVSSLTISNVASGAVLVVNVPGTTPATWTNFGSNVTGASSDPKKQIIFNFADATTVNFNSIEVPGTVLAPRGMVYMGTGGGQFRGNIVANSVDLRSTGTFGGSEFTGTYNVVTSVPTAATGLISKIVFRRANALPGKVWVIAPQTDGKILIGGEFSHINGTACRNIARLNADGTTDTTFAPNSGGSAGPNGAVQAIKPLGNGKVLVGGDFGTWNGSSAGAKLVLLTSTGARDTGFTSTLSTGSTDTVRMIEGDPAGTSFWVGGSFTAPKNNLARIVAASGAADVLYALGGSGPNGRVNSGTASGLNIIIGGDFTSFNGTARSYLAKVSVVGTLDSSLATSIDAGVDAVFTASGASWFHAGGRFSNHGGQARSKLTGANASTGASMQGPWGPTGMTINSISNIE